MKQTTEPIFRDNNGNLKNKMKHKVGDIVRVKPLSWYEEQLKLSGGINVQNNNGYYFANNMTKYCGKVTKVEKVLGDEYYILSDCGNYNWVDDFIEDIPVTELFEMKLYNYHEKIKAPKDYKIADVSFNEDEVTVYYEKENKYPMSYEEINNFKITSSFQYSSIKRKLTFITLAKLIELRDEWNRVDGFNVDWENEKQIKHCIKRLHEIQIIEANTIPHLLFFMSFETANLFFKTFNALIETAKELL